MDYKRPPIIEAVIDLRFVKPLSDDHIVKIGNKLSKSYPFQDEANNVNIHVDIEKQKMFNRGTRLGRRLTSLDRADITIINAENAIFSRLAPYQGWEQLKKRAREDWEICLSVCRPIGISRIGVRYINRIDIEISAERPINLEDYFHVYPETRALKLPAAEVIAMQVMRPLGDLGALVAMNMASVPSPLLNHAGFILDFDIGITDGLPQHDSELWKLADQIRVRKNELFERAITDNARELFNK